MHKHIPVNVVTRNLVKIVPKKALSWFSRTLHSGQNQVEGFMLPEDPFVSTTAFWFSLICLLSSLEVAPLVAQLHLICLFPSHLPTWWWEKQISSWKDRKLDCSQKDYLKIKKKFKKAMEVNNLPNQSSHWWHSVHPTKKNSIRHIISLLARHIGILLT